GESGAPRFNSTTAIFGRCMPATVAWMERSAIQATYDVAHSPGCPDQLHELCDVLRWRPGHDAVPEVEDMRSPVQCRDDALRLGGHSCSARNQRQRVKIAL